MIYLDHNATAPLSPVARKAWLDAHEHCWHNPSSPYRPASRARAFLEEARLTLAGMMDLDDPERLLFNSGASEGNNTIIHYYARQAKANAGPLLISPIEHASLNEAIKSHWSGKVETLPVDSNGRLAPADLAKRLNQTDQPKPTLVCLIAANNETGVLQDWSECAAICRQHSVPFHCDASQWLGRLPLSGFANCDWLTASGHKCGGPRNIGILLRPPAVNGLSLIAGGGQEHGQRGGTEDLPGILAMLAALESLADAPAREALASARDAFEKAVCDNIPGCLILSKTAPRLWNTSAMILPMREQHQWLNALEQHGILASSGSACAGHRVGGTGSHVPLAMGLSTGQARHLLRFSGGSRTSSADWQQAAKALVTIFQNWQKNKNSDKEGSSKLTHVIEIPE